MNWLLLAEEASEKVEKEPITADTLVQGDLWRSLILNVPQIISGLVVIIVFYVVGNFFKKVVVKVCFARGLDDDLARFLGRILKYVIVAFGLVTGLGTMGVDVGAMVAGVGLTGFALGFALKDIVSNILAGVMILMHRPFTDGDRVKVGGHEGIVLDIDLRYTTMDADGKIIFVPNSKLMTEIVVVEDLDGSHKRQVKENAKSTTAE